MEADKADVAAEENNGAQVDDESEFAPISAAEALCALIEAAQNLGMQTSPTPKEPFRVIAEIDLKDVPQRMFNLVKAIERLNQTDISELDQILDGAVTQLNLKIALYTVLGWIAAQGLPTREVSQMIMKAVTGPIKPNGSVNKLQEARYLLTTKMGNAAPKIAPGA